MKKLFSFIALIFLLAACSQAQTEPVSDVYQDNLVQEPANQTSTAEYQEIKTNLTPEMVEDGDPEKEITNEMKRLEKEGQTFWHDPTTVQSGRTEIPTLERKIECKDGIKSEENCSITGLLALPEDIPAEFKTGECEEGPGIKKCLIIEPQFPKDLINSLKQEAGFYAWGKDFYSIGSLNGDDNYSVYKNSDEIFSDKMFFGTDSVVADFGIINDNLAFTYYDLDRWMDENNPVVTSNIYYQDETLNQKYSLESSSYPFGYKDKIGFIAKENDKPFFFFNGQRVTENFDTISAYSCCMSSAYPIEVDQNGILFFMAKRGEAYYFVEVDLNKYL